MEVSCGCRNMPNENFKFRSWTLSFSNQSRSDKSNHGESPQSSFNEGQSVISEDTSSERPVETLKKMLFTVQSLTRSNEDISDQDGNDHSLQTQSESLTEGK